MPDESQEQPVDLDFLREMGLDPSLFASGGQETAPVGVPPTRLTDAGETVPFFVQRARRPTQDPTGEQFGFVDVAPTFFDGDEYRIFDVPVEDRLRLKKTLIDAGFYEASGVKPKAGWSDNDLGVYARLLGYANQIGATNERDAIRRFKRERTMGEVQFGDGLAGTVQLPAPEDMRRAVRQATVQEIGRSLEPDEEQAIIDAYTNVYSQRVQGNIAPPSVDAFVEQQIEAGPHGTEADAYGLVNKINTLLGIGGTITGPAVNAPQPTPGPF